MRRQRALDPGLDQGASDPQIGETSGHETVSPANVEKSDIVGEAANNANDASVAMAEPE